MSDASLTHVEELDWRTRRKAIEALDALARTLRDKPVPFRPVRASGVKASPAEGLALVQDFIAIEDFAVRQALLDVTATLAG